MESDANFFLLRKRQPSWTDAIQARVGFSLLLLVFLAIPTFFLLIQNTRFLLLYLIFPFITAGGLYLRYRGKEYLSNFIIVLSIYGVLVWMAWLAGFVHLGQLGWWVIALLPWVMFSEKHTAGLIVTTALPVLFSFLIPHLQLPASPLLPAEQDFIMQIVRISIALGAFSCIYFLRKHFFESEKLRILENEFYSNTLNTIPLPIIIKDGITLDFVFFNQAAQLTYDLKPAAQNSNNTTFSESCAVVVSRLDQEVLRSVTYHIEPDENLVHQTGLHWHFRTYRIPLELKSSGRRLLISISEDLRALNLAMEKAQVNKETLTQIFRFSSPMVIRFDQVRGKVSILNPQEWLPQWNETTAELCRYLEYFLPLHAKTTEIDSLRHRFSVMNRAFDLYYGYSPSGKDLTGLVLEIPPAE